MAFDIIGGDARIVAQEDEWLALQERAVLNEPPTTESLTRCSCFNCGAERYVALLGAWSACSVCGCIEFIPTRLAEALELRLGHSRPFTKLPPAA